MIRTLMALAVAGATACSATAGPGERGPAAPSDPPDQCGAAAHQWLVGRNRSEIPAKPEGAVWRVACTTCPVTMDYSPRRMNIFFDEATGVIREVRCG